jgi:type I restriction enzyme, S subunit
MGNSLSSITLGYKQTDVGSIPEDWSAEKLENVAPLQRGFDLPNRELRKGEFPVVYSNGIMNFHNEYKAKAPGVVTGRSGTIGKVNFIEQDYFPHNTSLWVTDFKGNDPKFIYYLYKSVKLEIFGTGSGVPTLNRNDVHIHKIPLPPLTEQQAIAEVLSDVDALITSLDQLINKKRNIKQGTMQLLLTGKKRLPGFSGDWETKTLGEIIKLQSGYSFKSELFVKIGIPIVRISNIVDEKVNLDGAVQYPLINIPKEFVIKRGDALIAMSGATTGKVGVYKFPFESYQNQRVGKFVTQNKAKSSLQFVYQIVSSQTFKIKLFKDIEQGAQPNISGKQIESLEFKIPPTKEEQKAIAQILSDMDSEIEELETKRAKYKDLKQGMMQELLTGKIRLINPN